MHETRAGAPVVHRPSIHTRIAKNEKPPKTTTPSYVKKRGRRAMGLHVFIPYGHTTPLLPDIIFFPLEIQKLKNQEIVSVTQKSWVIVMRVPGVGERWGPPEINCRTRTPLLEDNLHGCIPRPLVAPPRETTPFFFFPLLFVPLLAAPARAAPSLYLLILFNFFILLSLIPTSVESCAPRIQLAGLAFYFLFLFNMRI